MRIYISLRLQPILIGPIFNLLSDFWTLASSGPTYISHERSPSGVERKETWHAKTSLASSERTERKGSKVPGRKKRRALWATEPTFKTRLKEAIRVVNSSRCEESESIEPTSRPIHCSGILWASGRSRAVCIRGARFHHPYPDLFYSVIWDD